MIRNARPPSTDRAGSQGPVARGPDSPVLFVVAKAGRSGRAMTSNESALVRRPRAAAVQVSELETTGARLDLIIATALATLASQAAFSGDTAAAARRAAAAQTLGWRVAELAQLPEPKLIASTGAGLIETPLPLTPREREVASLVARGLSNRLIAERLVIATVTVERHIANILGKLGAHSRAQIAVWACERGFS